MVETQGFPSRHGRTSAKALMQWPFAATASPAASVACAAPPAAANPSFEEGQGAPTGRTPTDDATPDNLNEKPARPTLFEWQPEGALDSDRAELYPVKLSHSAVGPGERQADGSSPLARATANRGC
jgi:hypothetical protein